MKTVTRLLLCVFALFAPSLAAAQAQETLTQAGARLVAQERWVEEWDHSTQSWVRVADIGADFDRVAMADDGQQTGTVTTTTTVETIGGVITTQTTTFLRDASRFQALPQERGSDFAPTQYGPFRVIDDRSAAIVGATSANAPYHFDAMLRDFPELEVIELIEAPGTNHDLANLALGRRIRAAGLATHVPDGGSVRSGAVELFLAGATRTIEDGAEFAVHSWLDAYGREPDDFAPDAPENRLYLDYYVEMGMSEARARDFYAMTNSVPHHSALWLSGDEMRNWVKERKTWTALHDQALQIVLPAITYEPVEVHLSAAKIAYPQSRAKAEPA